MCAYSVYAPPSKMYWRFGESNSRNWNAGAWMEHHDTQNIWLSVMWLKRVFTLRHRRRHQAAADVRAFSFAHCACVRACALVCVWVCTFCLDSIEWSDGGYTKWIHCFGFSSLIDDDDDQRVQTLKNSQLPKYRYMSAFLYYIYLAWSKFVVLLTLSSTHFMNEFVRTTMCVCEFGNESMMILCNHFVRCIRKRFAGNQWILGKSIFVESFIGNNHIRGQTTKRTIA